MSKIWEPIRVGNMQWPHRLVMAPMTRDRADANGAPNALNAEYYGQRATMALSISEGTQPNADGQGYLLTPGMHDEAHVAGWRKVSEAVHAAGGHLFVQLMHVGRVAHPENTPHHRQPVAPSAVKPSGQMFTFKGMLDLPEPRALTSDEVQATIQDFRRAAKLAVQAGADGVEVHGANGYLVQQFLASNANQRTDQWGGSMENRVRFGVEVARAIAEEIGPERVGFRISPGNTYNDIQEQDVHALYGALVSELAKLKLAYLHVMHFGDDVLLKDLRARWPNALIVNKPGADFAARAQLVEEGLADAASFGTMSLANPDLVARLRQDAKLNTPDPKSFYGGDARGYTDYPTL
ncbi:MAG: alkene reductase [Polyangiales bacterium]